MMTCPRTPEFRVTQEETGKCLPWTGRRLNYLHRAGPVDSEWLSKFPLPFPQRQREVPPQPESDPEESQLVVSDPTM